MDGMKGYKSWTLSDEFWNAVKGVIPDTRGKRDPNKVYRHKAGQGRKPLSPRNVLGDILYVLRTGCQWKAVPGEFGSGSSIHRYFQAWTRAGFFQKIWSMGMEKYDEIKGIGWEWQSVDGCMIKAPLARDSVGPNPTDGGKLGTKRSVLTDSQVVSQNMILNIRQRPIEEPKIDNTNNNPVHQMGF